MKFITTCFLIIIFVFSIAAQTSPQILAKANGQNFTVADLPQELREAFVNLPKASADVRKLLFNQQIAEILFEAEAKIRNISVDKLIETQVNAKVANPTEKQIQDVYDANRAALGNQTLEQVRPQIVTFLRREPEQKAMGVFAESLAKKYKVAVFKDINAQNLKAADVLANVNGKSITVRDFEAKNRVALYEQQANVYDQVKFALTEKIFSALVSAEAKTQNVEGNELIAQEITNKMRDFSNEERDELESDFRKKLFTKYNAQILLKEPAPLVLQISTDDDPSKGNTNAPVTVVMFSDFQCSACSAAHPVLQKVLAEYGDKIRFVVRDFPLTTIHQNAFQAALAANAANAQGKFFEYIEYLYRNQAALDKESLKRYAAEIGLNLAQFELDLQNETNAAEIRKDMADGANYGITGTPTIYVNGVKVRRNTAEYFREAINQALKKQ
ncbi:hypothetical protein BH10ACI1_BH10ACI1_05600 [soil metagenome]